MRTLVSTNQIAAHDRFRIWREAVVEQVMPLEITKIGNAPFSGHIEAARVGSLVCNRITVTGIRTDLTQAAIRRGQIDDTVSIALQASGSLTFGQADRDAVAHCGDIVVLDRRPSSILAPSGGQGLFIEIPRRRLERAIGPAKLYSRVRISAEDAPTQLATRFFRHLLEVHRSMAADGAERMSSIGVDLLIASIAERLAQDVPHALHGSVIVQRAKAQIEDHYDDPDFGPPELAAAVGVSLRRLQELFHERGQHISDYIWERRTAVAAQRLQDPCAVQIPIGLLALACGFSTQAHFSRRFKAQFGMTPREFRVERFRQSLTAASG